MATTKPKWQLLKPVSLMQKDLITASDTFYRACQKQARDIVGDCV